MAEIDYALNTFYLLMTGALVMWMAAGFTMLEAGFVRRRNTAEIVTKNIGLYSIACFMYLLCGFMVMYPGANEGGIIPPYDFGFGSKGQEDFGMNTDLGYADAADFFFQVVFVATAVSIVSGAVAERMNQWAFFALAAFIAGVIYPIQGFWNWGSGFLNAAGYSDFAGSGTVHLAGAACALGAAIFIGPRVGKYANGKVNKLYGANIPIAALGTFILWLGWFGFNGGSQLAVNDASNANAVAQVFLNTNMAAGGGVIACLLVSRIFFGKTNIIYALNGAISGLVAITAAPSTPTPLLATLFGAAGGILVVFSSVFLDKMKIDDLGFFYHSVKERNIVGIVRVIAEAHNDTTTNDSTWRCVDLAYHKSFTNPVNLDTIKLTASLSDMVLVKNSRLSVQPVTEREWNIICDMGQPQ